ncbi:Flp family type IVb pilin [Celeribacter halophilus]|uniref:Flp family type IVb pilin n=1 Tax=Celeribacter halophilus TaxID=576117 RepID=UPI003A9242F0
MKLFKFAKNFARDEDGAVTVDWVVLTAAIVGLGIAVITSVSTGVSGLGDKISTEINTDAYIGKGVTTTGTGTGTGTGSGT